MKKQSFFNGAILLIIGAFIAKVLGALYKIPLTNIIGSEGIGMYYLVFPLYNLLLVICSSGVGLAVTKLVAKERYIKNRRRIFSSGMLISAVASIISAVFVVLFSKSLALQQGGVLQNWGFVIIAPSIIVSSLIAVSKSYFQGEQNMLPSTLTMIAEQVFKLLLGIVFTLLLIDKGVEYAVLGTILGVTLSEAITFILLFAYVIIINKKNVGIYNRENKLLIKKIRKIANNRGFLFNMHSYKRLTIKDVSKAVLSEMVPNTLIYLVSPMATFLDSFIIIKLLVKAGYSSSVATSLYGLNSGVVATLIALPVIITSSLSTVFVPNLSESIKVCNSQKNSEKISFFIKITWTIILPICIFFIIFSEEIITALYNFSSIGEVNELAFAIKLLKISSVSVIYSALMSTLIAVIQSIEKPYKLFVVLCMGMALRFLFLVLAMKRLNIFGVVIANDVYYIFAIVWCIKLIKDRFDLRFSIYRLFLIPSVAVAVGGGMSIFIVSFLKNGWFKMMLGGSMLVIIYMAILLLFRAFDDGELDYIPMLRKLYITGKNGHNSRK